MSSKTRTNWTYVTTVVIVYAFMLGAAAISFSHIVDISHTLGLRWEAWTVPFFVDGIAVLGKIGRSRKFAAKTQRAGLYLMTGAGLLSLACNVMAGDNLGQQLFGVLVVAGFVTTEWYAAKLEAAPAPVIVTVDDATRAKRSAAAVKAAATRKANAAKAKRRPRTPLLTQQPTPVVALVQSTP
jgi:hypothetical protein